MKSGKFTISQIMELVLSVAAVFVLLLLMVALFGPNFKKLDKGAEGYYNTLMEQIAIADEGGEGEFSLWQAKEEKSEVDFFLIYFGETWKLELGRGNEKRGFPSLGGENRLCICYWDGEDGTCDYCEELEYPILYEGEYEPWGIASGRQVLITKGEDQYEFVKIKQ